MHESENEEDEELSSRIPIHIIPTFDMREHEDSFLCWCFPKITNQHEVDEFGDTKVYIHYLMH